MEKEKVLNYIKSSKSKSFLEIAKYFKISPSNNKSLTSLLSVLQKEYKVFKNSKDEYYAPELIDTITGILNVNAKGQFGFVDYNIDEVNKTKDSVYIRNFNFNTAIHNDVVKVYVFKNPHEADNELKTGVVVEVLERTNQNIIGFIKQKNSSTYFVPVDQKMKNVSWLIVSNTLHVKLNDLVSAKILKYENKTVLIEIEKIITNEADPMVFVKSYLEQIKAPDSFPDSLNEEIINIPKNIDKEDLTNRIDLTDTMIVTIDGDDTKDFDDAIYVKKLDNGNYFLGVYIADVSYYVKENTEIDKEALKRGTSIYLVDRVIPMLPFELSNGICSLNPNEKRFVLACEMEINAKGNNLSVNIFQGIIESKFRLTYKQVDSYYKTQTIQNLEIPHDLSKMLDDAKELSLILHKYKLDEGYVDFEISEPKIKLNTDGSVKEIQINERGFSEVLIEDFMVRTNETVAKYLYDQKLPVLYRVHEIPDAEKLLNLKNTLETVGINSAVLPKKITPKSFAEFVDYVKTQRDDDFMKLTFLRTMQKAIYSDNNIEHFGLASKFYCHFTSPIRRYPDLIIHRIIRNFLINKKTNELTEFKNNLPTFGDLNTKAEQKAVQIERNVNDLKFAEYLKFQVGKTFKTQIVSILNFGFFVEFEFMASGLVHKTTLIDGTYEANETLTQLISEKRVFKVGDFVEVVVLGVDLVQGKIDCCLSDLYPKLMLKKETEAKKGKQNVSKKFRKQKTS
ncbi:ribonuclease R [Mycoplasmopsis felis]|uniref:ribonuclease R n=1 Tax=Mycoplasmopsis felis TaxID=33923 RepID=UPI002AFE5BCA|nr:ribonuclease R [Mycoplasmopsis felis]WQQ08973.1 ribonuclease R [Mycoplasmopsis felis]